MNMTAQVVETSLSNIRENDRTFANDIDVTANQSGVQMMETSQRPNDLRRVPRAAGNFRTINQTSRRNDDGSPSSTVSPSSRSNYFRPNEPAPSLLNHTNNTRKRSLADSKIGSSQPTETRAKRRNLGSQEGNQKRIPKVPGRLLSVQLENFMCHSHIKLEFDVDRYNCFYIVGPNGSGKSAIFAGINMALGGGARSNERAKNMHSYVKEGAKHCRLRVVLTNQGEGSYQPEKYGKAIIVERAFTNDSGAAKYTLKGIGQQGGEIVVSERKKDLDAMLDHFFIELENPLSWLSQNCSRQFFSTMKPSSLYQLFAEGTRLLATEGRYKSVEINLESVAKILEDLQGRKTQLKNEYRSKKERFEKAAQLSELRVLLKKLTIQSLWAPIRDIDETLNETRGKMEKAEALKPDIVGRREAIKQNLVNVAAIRDENSRNQAASKKQMDERYATVKVTMTECNNLKTKASNETSEATRRCQNEITALDREYKETNEQISKLIGDSNRDLDSERQNLSTQQNELDNEAQMLEDQKRAAVAEEKRLDEEMLTRLRKIRGIDCEYDNRLNQIEHIKKEQELLVRSQNDRLLLFGESVPLLLKKIKEHSNKFQQPPIGPIGNCIALNDQRWGPAVEFHLRNLLNHFIVGSANDRKVFQNLCNYLEIPIPGIVVTRYSEQPFDTRSKEPESQILTIAKAIKTQNATVFNMLVDNAHIETTMLFEDDAEARQIMSTNPPRNVTRGVTRSCGMLYPLIRIANIVKPYRYYVGWFHARVFPAHRGGGYNNQEMAELNARIKNLEEENHRTREGKPQALREQRETAAALRKAREDLKEIDVREDEIRKKRETFLRQEEELQKLSLSGPIIKNLRDALSENRENYAKQEKKLAEVKVRRRELMEEIDALNTRVNETQKEFQKAKAEYFEFEESTANASNQWKAFRDEMNEAEEKFKKLNRLFERYEEEITLAKERRAKLVNDRMKEREQVELPEGMDYPPNLDEIPPTENLERESVKIQKTIRNIESGGRIPTRDQLDKLRTEFDKLQREVRFFTDIHCRLKKLLEERQQGFHFLKYSLPLKLEMKFKEKMVLRGYSASLQVDHSKQEISIRVDTHRRQRNGEGDTHATQPARFSRRGAATADDDEDDEMEPAAKYSSTQSGGKERKQTMQDLKGLSGGERSYTTASFVMALWHSIQTPFRLLDEFDVFMDMLNRRVVMKEFVEYAVQHRNTQSFFFTPQGVRELKRDDVQVFDLPKVRGGLLGD